MSLSNTLQWLAKILYPNGRAFRMPEPVAIAGAGGFDTEDGSDVFETEDGTPFVSEGTTVGNPANGIFFRFHRAINITLSQLFTDVTSLLDSLMPDNPNFTMGDAIAWYRRLGIFYSGNVLFSDMCKAILQKQSFPLVPLDKQYYLFIQAQLQSAGFNVNVYENRFSDGMGGYTTKTPATVLGIAIGQANYGNFDYGQLDYGAAYINAGVSVIANYIEDARDAYFTVTNYRSTFYIAGSSITTFANVPIGRHDEFRQLILKLKRAEMVGFLFVNYV